MQVTFYNHNDENITNELLNRAMGLFDHEIDVQKAYNTVESAMNAQFYVYKVYKGQINDKMHTTKLVFLNPITDILLTEEKPIYTISLIEDIPDNKG